MKIVKSSENLSVKDIYHLTMNPQTQKMKDVIGQRIEIAAWAEYEDLNRKDNTTQNILAIKTPDGETFATNSPTFKNDFSAMVELFESMGEKVGAVEVVSGTSNAGREYITCVYAD